MEITDSTICSLFNQRQEKGMELLFARYYKTLVIWAVSLLKDIPQAEDLVQDFFIKLWEKGHKQVLQPQTLKSFLYTSVRNLAFDRIEKKDPLSQPSSLSFLDTPWEEYDNMQEEILLLIKKEIANLPERTRDVVNCIYLKGMSYKDTAQFLGVSVATVNTLLVHALKKLRQIKLENFEFPLLFFFYPLRTSLILKNLSSSHRFNGLPTI